MRIFRLWGIPIHKMLSDTEFVYKTRKWLRLHKKFVWIHVVALILLSVFVPWLIDIIQQMIELMPDEDRKLAWMGLLVGFIFGAFIEQYVVMAMQAILVMLDLFDYNRSTKLLIKYHDMLKDLGILEPYNDLKDGQA